MKNRSRGNVFNPEPFNRALRSWPHLQAGGIGLGGVQRVPLAFTELDGGDLSLRAANVASKTQRGFRP